MNQPEIHAAATLATLLFFLTPSPVRGAVVCYDEEAFPSVSRLERQGEGLRILLGPQWWKGTKPATPRQAPAMTFDKAHGWKLEPDLVIPAEADQPACAGLVPPIPLTWEEAVLLRPHVGEWGRKEIEQKIGACEQVGDVVWFGISFYDGEGADGVGGVGRYDLGTKQLEVRRLAELRDASINHLLHDGTTLWLATYHDGECIGELPVSGLVRYNWAERMVWEETEVCGFVYHGLAMIDGDVWVASDLGLSRGRPGKDGIPWAREWENFVPVPDKPALVEPVECDKLYARLLESLPPELGDVRGMGTPWPQLFEQLVERRPGFLARYVNERIKQSRGGTTP